MDALLNTRNSFLTLLVLIPLHATASPKLAVVVVVDQMQAKTIQDAPKKFSKGLKILSEKSLVYVNTHLAHIPTETSPGHAAVITGKPPGETGIIGNEWWDREKKKTVKSVDDPQFGLGPAQLMTKTLGDLMKEANQESQVVSISFKDRSAIMMGGRSGDLVLWFNPFLQRFGSSKAYPPPPEWLNEFNRNNRLMPWSSSSKATDILTFDLIKKVLNNGTLGQDDHCDLLAIGLAGTDYVGHKFGPDGVEMAGQLASLDKILGELIEILSKRTNGDFILALTSDHGVLPLPESPQGKKISARRLSPSTFGSQLEEVCQNISPSPSKWILHMQLPDIYLNKAYIETQKLDWGQFLLKVQAEWMKIPEVAMVYFNNPLISQDKYSANYQRSFFAGRSGDLLIRLKPGVIPTNARSGTDHGSAYEYDTHVPLLFYGKGFPSEGNTTPVSNEILAPTLAQSMGLSFN